MEHVTVLGYQEMPMWVVYVRRRDVPVLTVPVTNTVAVTLSYRSVPVSLVTKDTTVQSLAVLALQNAQVKVPVLLAPVCVIRTG